MSLWSSLRAIWHDNPSELSTALVLAPSQGPARVLASLLAALAELIWGQSLLRRQLGTDEILLDPPPLEHDGQDEEDDEDAAADEVSALQRPLLRSRDNDTYVSAATLLRVDHTLRLFVAANPGRSIKEITGAPDRLLYDVAARERVPTDSPAFRLLRTSLARISRAERAKTAANDRAHEHFDLHNPLQLAALKELWAQYLPVGARFDSPDEPVSRRWQEVGFQGPRPWTDFRKTGMFAVDTLLHFVHTYDERAVAIAQEAVNGSGGLNWYPFALASIAVAELVLRLAQQGDLQMYIFRALQTVTASPRHKSEAEPLLNAHAELLLAFHDYWRQRRAHVMQFEQVFADFAASLLPSLRRGYVDTMPA